MRKSLSMIAAVALAAAGSAGAQTMGFNGAKEIARGDYAGAEKIIERSRRLSPDFPDLMLNLATVYRQTGRADQARALYREVLQQPDEQLDVLTTDRPASSHAVAMAALASSDIRIAAR